MILEILIFILSTIICYYLYSYKKLHWYFKDRDVKFLPGIPLFGNIFRTTFQKVHFNDEMDTLYSAFPEEKYMGYFEMTVPILLIRDPDIMKNIIVKDFDHFVDHRQFFTAESDPLFAASLFLMQGDKWRDMRNTLSPAFTASKMKYMLPFIREIANNIVDYLEDHSNEAIDVDDLMRRYTNDVIASAGFGLQVNSVKERDNEFYKIGSSIFDFSVKQRALMALYGMFPSLGKKLGARIFSDKVYDFFTNIVATTIEYRKKEKVERPDMIQLLMEAKKEWTPSDLTGQVFIFFTAGFETSATVLVLTVHELALNTNIQEKLYQECRKFKEEKELTFDNLHELKYLDCIINESMRKWSPAIILDRMCTKTYELPPPREGGKPYKLHPGDVVYNMVNQVQMDPKYWPDPYKYDPERFSDDNKQDIKPYTFMPFGVGPRACIGMRFALMEFKVLMYYLILNFKILKTEKTQNPIKIKPHSFNIRAVGGTYVQFEERLSK